MRHLHHPRLLHALVGRGGGAGERRLRDHRRTGRQRLSQPGIACAFVPRRQHEHAGGRLHPLLADDRPLRCRSATRRSDDAPAARLGGDDRQRESLPRTGGRAGMELRCRQSDRALDLDLRARRIALLTRRHRVPDERLRRRSIRAARRHAGRRRPVPSRQRERALAHLHRPQHRGRHDRQRPVPDVRAWRAGAGRNRST